MLSSFNCGKYFTRTYEIDRNDAEWDKTRFTSAEQSFLDVTDGEGKIKAEAELLQETGDDCVLSIH